MTQHVSISVPVLSDCIILKQPEIKKKKKEKKSHHVDGTNQSATVE